MANQNNPNRVNNNTDAREIFSAGTTNLWPVPATAFTIPGYLPDSCTFKIPRSKLEADLLKILKGFSDDFERVSFEFNPNTHQVSLWAWIKSDSPDIVDNRYKNRDDFIISSPMLNLSPRMRALRDRFGTRPPKKDYKNDNPNDESIQGRRFNFVVPSNGDRRFLGTQLDLDAVIRSILDVNDDVYKVLYEKIRQDYHTKNFYALNIGFHSDREGRVNTFVITKRRRESSRSDDLHPKQARYLESD